MTDASITRWTGWIEDEIRSEVLTMHLQRDAWEQIQAIVHANGQLPDSYFWQFLFDTYSASQAAAVRRQADHDDRTASLYRLIYEIGAQPGLITEAFWLGLMGDHPDGYAVMQASGIWRTHFGHDGGTELDPALPTRDLADLTSALRRVKNYVDKHIAHCDADPLPAGELPTLLEVHEAIDVIGELFRRYEALLTGVSSAMLTPVHQDDWVAIFREPWIKPMKHGR